MYTCIRKQNIIYKNHKKEIKYHGVSKARAYLMQGRMEEVAFKKAHESTLEGGGCDNGRWRNMLTAKHSISKGILENPENSCLLET